MTIQHKELKHPELFVNGIDFKPYYAAGVKGLSDIDGIYERHGKFLIFDEKRTAFKTVRIYWGQFQMYRKLQEALGDNAEVFFSIFHNNHVFVMFVDVMKGKYRFKGDKHIFYEDVLVSDGKKMTEEQYYKWFAKLAGDLNVE